MTLESKLKEIKKRCEAATEGPWKSEHEFGDDNDAFNYIYGPRDYNASTFWDCDADFIAHARTDVPMLLEMLEATIDWEDEFTLKAFEKIAEKYK